MAEQHPQWTTLESDPGVFTHLIADLGARHLQVEELYDLESGTLAALKPHGLIFLFKWTQEVAPRATLAEHEYLGQVYFARQTVPNACATQAILSVLFNRPQLQLGPDLVNLKDFTIELPPELKGLAIGNAETLRRVHNSFSPPHDGSEAKDATDKDDVYHFVAYVCIQGAIYELDGLQAGPIRLTSSTEEEWVERVKPYIQQRMAQYSASEIRFNLMAVVPDQAEARQEELAELAKQKEALEKQLRELNGAGGEAAAGGALRSSLVQVEDAMSQARRALGDEEAKRARWRNDSLGRQFFHTPFVYGLLQAYEQRRQQRRQAGLAP